MTCRFGFSCGRSSVCANFPCPNQSMKLLVRLCLHSCPAFGLWRHASGTADTSIGAFHSFANSSWVKRPDRSLEKSSIPADSASSSLRTRNLKSTEFKSVSSSTLSFCPLVTSGIDAGMMHFTPSGTLTRIQRCRSLAVVTAHQTHDAGLCAAQERVPPKRV